MAIRLVNTASMLDLLRNVNVARAVLVCNLALVVWVAYGAATMTWRMFCRESAGDAEIQPVLTESRPDRRGDAVSPQALAGLHLFGDSKAPAPVRSAPPKEVPLTRLKLSLRGVISSDEPSGAWAIVAGPGGDEQGYGIDDILPGNAKLSEIHAEHIVLLHQGRKEILKLESGPDLKGPRERVMQRARQERRRNEPKVGELLKRYREDLQSNPSTLLKIVRPIPVKKEGRFVGFRLGLGRDRQALRQFDLEPGDIVTAINGVVLDNPTKGIDALRNLKSADMLDLQVERNGEAFRRTFQMP